VIDGISNSGVVEYPESERREEPSGELIEELTVKLQTVMWKYVGIVRTDERLFKALTHVRAILTTAEQMYAACRLTPELLELRNLAQTSELIVLSALERKESRGLNYNLDHPNVDDRLCKVDTVLDKEMVSKMYVPVL
jgi:L-aspartate oxidase